MFIIVIIYTCLYIGKAMMYNINVIDTCVEYRGSHVVYHDYSYIHMYICRLFRFPYALWREPCLCRQTGQPLLMGRRLLWCVWTSGCIWMRGMIRMRKKFNLGSWFSGHVRPHLSSPRSQRIDRWFGTQILGPVPEMTPGLIFPKMADQNT